VLDGHHEHGAYLTDFISLFNFQNEQSTAFNPIVSTPKASSNIPKNFVAVLPNLKESFIYACCSLMSEIS
jgi:hypothetical protein